MVYSQTSTASLMMQANPSNQSQMEDLIPPVIAQFNQILKGNALFNFSFFLIGVLECLLLIVFFTFFIQSSLLALSLAAVFFTISAYFVLKLYFQAQQKEQFELLKDQFTQLCKSRIQYQKGTPEHHVALANACTRFANQIQGIERAIYQPPQLLKFLNPCCQQLGYFYHWHDVHQMRELMLYYAVDEYIQLIRCAPINLDVHTALANSYVTLAGIYRDPRNGDEGVAGKILFNHSYIESLKQKYYWASERAIEELKILLQFAPCDPWIHAQLACSYHELNRPLEEIREYEAILKIDPDNADALSKLGILYFQQGMNAQGLAVYEQLKDVASDRAEQLIHYYGTHFLEIT